MADPDLQIREVGGGGGRGGEGHPDPEIRGAPSLKKIFRLFGPQLGLKIRGGGGLPRIRHWSDRSDSLKKRPILITLL